MWKSFRVVTVLGTLGFLLAIGMRFAPQATHADTAPTFTQAETRITTSTAQQFDPAIAGDLVSYIDNRNGNLDVYYTNLNTGAETPVVMATGDQELTDVSGQWIVYDDVSTQTVKVYDTSTGTTTQVSDNGSVAADPAIGGSLVAWSDNRDGNYEIYARDLSTGAERRVSNDPAPDQKPDVSGNWIVWQRCPINCQIWAYNWATQATLQVTNVLNADHRNPAVYSDSSGSRVVYEGLRNGERDIYAYDFDTHIERQLALPGEQLNPQISSNEVVFEDTVTGISHLKLWDPTTGVVYDLSSVSPTSSQFLPDIDGNHIVYTDDRNTQLDIYMLTFTITPADTTPPVLSLPVPITMDATSPAGATVTYSVTATDPDNVPADLTISCTAASGSTFVIGTTIVTCTAKDPAGNSTSGSFTVTVKGATEQISDLISTVQSINLKQGIANSLDAKLQNVQGALTAANAGNRQNACNAMDAFINEVQAQAGNAITSADADQLITAAQRIKAVMSCPA